MSAVSGNADNRGTILYFEDDVETREQVVEFLRQERYDVVSFSRFPEGGVKAVQAALSSEPDMVLIDIRMPGKDGYQVGRELRDGFLSPYSSIIFMSELLERHDIQYAFDAGGDDYMTKPIRLEDLKAKLSHISVQRMERIQLLEKEEMSRRMAAKASPVNAELAAVLRYHDLLHNIKDLRMLGKHTTELVSEFGLASSILFVPDDVFVRDDGIVNALERDVLKVSREQGEIYQWKNRLIFNFPNFSLLVRNMPVEDEERCNTLRDQLKMLLNGLSGRVNSLNAEKSSERKRKKIKITADIIANMVIEMEQGNTALSERFDAIIIEMENYVSHDIMRFNLLEHEEASIMDHIRNTTAKSSELLESSMKQERQYKDIMKQLLGNLASSME